MYILLNNVASDLVNSVSVDRVGVVSSADPMNCAVEAATLEAEAALEAAVEAEAEAVVEGLVEAELEAIARDVGEEGAEAAAAEQAAAAMAAQMQQAAADAQAVMQMAANFGADDVDLIGELRAAMAALGG